MTSQTWTAESYDKNARFVSDSGAPVLQLLAPVRGERILDIGCGDGVLTKKISNLGCEVTGVDSSDAMIEAARARCRCYDLDYRSTFDAVYSNAALHWMKDPSRAIGKVAQALRANGRFVAEMGDTAACRPCIRP